MWDKEKRNKLFLSSREQMLDYIDLRLYPLRIVKDQLLILKQWFRIWLRSNSVLNFTFEYHANLLVVLFEC